LAPTPSGYLHAGNAFNFLVTERLARISGSTLVLRIDDMDAERVRPEYIEDIFLSLEWLGVQCDEGPSGPEEFHTKWSQHLRIHEYMALVDELRARGAIYPCSCSRIQFQEIQRTGAPHSCRTSPTVEVPLGTPWRSRMPNDTEVAIRQLNGTVELAEPATLLPDPIIQQRDTGRPAYQIASLSDDLKMGISMIVRGADLVPSTVCQLYLAQILRRDSFREARFHHHPICMDADGQKLSKSAGSGSLKAMREAGSAPTSLITAAEGYVDWLLADIKA